MADEKVEISRSELDILLAEIRQLWLKQIESAAHDGVPALNVERAIFPLVEDKIEAAEENADVQDLMSAINWAFRSELHVYLRERTSRQLDQAVLEVRDVDVATRLNSYPDYVVTNI